MRGRALCWQGASSKVPFPICGNPLVSGIQNLLFKKLLWGELYEEIKGS